MLRATFIGDEQELTEVLCDRMELADGTLRLYRGRGRSETVMERIPQGEVGEVVVRHSDYPKKGLGVKVRLALPGSHESQWPVGEEVNIWAASIRVKGGAAGDGIPAKLLADIVGFDAVPSLWGDPAWNVSLPGVTS